MIDKIKNFFVEKINVPSEYEDIVSEKSVTIAACALFLEMAHADSEFSSEESEKIISILKEQYNLAKEDAIQLMHLADLERKESLDLWQFTNLINQNYSAQDKRKVVEILWRLIYSDGKVDKYEEYLIRRLTFLLNLDHKDMIEAKFRARDQD